MKLSKEAQEGFNYSIERLEELLAVDSDPNFALQTIGIKSMEDMFWFFTYLNEYGHKKLLNKLIK